VPILHDIRDHEVLGEEYKNGLRAGMRRLIKKRFGAIPPWSEERLSEMSWVELENLADRFLDVNSIEELFQQCPSSTTLHSAIDCD
jgi:hypothetical protein